MFVLRARPSVKFDTIKPAGFRLLAALDSLPDLLKRDVELTSGTDSHRPPDPHWSGEAYDISIKGWSADEIELALRHLRLKLGDAFTVLYEVPKPPSDPTLRSLAYINVGATGDHFHLQRKKGTVYPPL